MIRKVTRRKPKAGKEQKEANMDHPSQRVPESADPKAENSDEREDRRSRRRDEGAISRIEDITYSVLRKHKPQP